MCLGVLWLAFWLSVCLFRCIYTKSRQHTEAAHTRQDNFDLEAVDKEARKTPASSSRPTTAEEAELLEGAEHAVAGVFQLERKEKKKAPATVSIVAKYPPLSTFYYTHIGARTCLQPLSARRC